MADQFDPYHKWLGIPPRDQPPNHYRLLGIEMFEDDGDVIEAAANRLMAYLQDLSTGQHMEHAQRVLNEVNTARLCLLATDKRSAYDAQLKAKSQKPTPQTRPQPAAPAPPKAMPVQRVVPVARSAVAAPPPQVVSHPCPSCSAARRAPDASCQRCGYDAQLSAITQLDKEQPRVSERSGIIKKPKGLNEPPKKQNIVLVASLIGGLIVLISAGLAGFFLFSTTEKPKLASTPNTAEQPTIPLTQEVTQYKAPLNIKIQPKDRTGVKLLIDGKAHAIPRSGSIIVSVNTGERTIKLTRPGHQPVETKVNVRQLGVNVITPSWKPVKRAAPSKTTPPKKNSQPANKTGAAIKPIGGKAGSIWKDAVVEARATLGEVQKTSASSFVVKEVKPGMMVYTINITTKLNPITAIRIHALTEKLRTGPGTSADGSAKLHHVSLTQDDQQLRLSSPWSNSNHERRKWNEAGTLEAGDTGWLIDDSDCGQDIRISYLVDYGKISPSDKPMQLELTFLGKESPFGHVKIQVTNAKNPYLAN